MIPAIVGGAALLAMGYAAFSEKKDETSNDDKPSTEQSEFRKAYLKSYDYEGSTNISPYWVRLYSNRLQSFNLHFNSFDEANAFYSALDDKGIEIEELKNMVLFPATLDYIQSESDRYGISAGENILFSKAELFVRGEKESEENFTDAN